MISVKCHVMCTGKSDVKTQLRSTYSTYICTMCGRLILQTCRLRIEEEIAKNTLENHQKSAMVLAYSGRNV